MHFILRWTATFALGMGLYRAYMIASGEQLITQILAFAASVVAAFGLLYLINKVSGGRLEDGYWNIRSTHSDQS